MKQLIPALLILLLVGCAKPHDSGGSKDLISRSDAIKNAYIGIKSESPEKIRDEIHNSLNLFQAAVIEENWGNDSEIEFTGSMTIQIPSDKFITMVDWIKKNYHVEQMSLRAAIITADDLKKGNLDKKGIPYSTINLTISRDIGFSESFMLGLSNAGDALKMSIRGIIPVLLFLLPYSIIGLVIFLLIKFVIRLAAKIRRYRAGKGN